MFEVLKSRYAVWKRYSRTVSELEMLSTRELADLGISRCDIPRLGPRGRPLMIGFSGLAQLLLRSRRMKAYRQARAEIEALSEADLADMGLKRYQLGHVARSKSLR